MCMYCLEDRNYSLSHLSGLFSVQKDAESNLTFMKLVRIRQDLEKSRNLSYMIQKREQLKRQQLNAEREMSMAELAFASTTPLPDPSAIPSRKYLELIIYLYFIYIYQ